MTDETMLIERYIEPNPNRPGLGEARLAHYGVSVWALVAYLEAVNGDIARVAEDYALPREAVEAALVYYRRHQNLIDARISASAA